MACQNAQNLMGNFFFYHSELDSLILKWGGKTMNYHVCIFRPRTCRIFLQSSIAQEQSFLAYCPAIQAHWSSSITPTDLYEGDSTAPLVLWGTHNPSAWGGVVIWSLCEGLHHVVLCMSQPPETNKEAALSLAFWWEWQPCDLWIAFKKVILPWLEE